MKGELRVIGVGVVFSAIVVGMAGVAAGFAAGFSVAAALACYPLAGTAGVVLFLWAAARRRVDTSHPPEGKT